MRQMNLNLTKIIPVNLTMNLEALDGIDIEKINF